MYAPHTVLLAWKPGVNLLPSPKHGNLNHCKLSLLAWKTPDGGTPGIYKAVLKQK